ncbi:hypothetical protein GBA63_21035 [Rubrobacter tropicus]|uniref:Secreted protein n=1 Tax=Rubrobacter tropicus TaxID=2653851 RepID=A0A6G8QEC8_9ACTN|nr:hypothetical protein [Rubrobacter tropicus]QIN84850.1 hypothetical protein GBA63_21035 [Rubrobacter tropicus]
MKKLIATGAVAALLLATASPAFAQDAIAVDDGVASGGDVHFFDASQSQTLSVTQQNTGDAIAAADDDSVAVAWIDQSLMVDQTQVNGGFHHHFGGFFFVN